MQMLRLFLLFVLLSFWSCPRLALSDVTWRVADKPWSENLGSQRARVRVAALEPGRGDARLAAPSSRCR